ncbi:MAG: chemotaxis-specific protein-glutamate methyltransferase CheB [Sphingomonas sp.]
MAISNTKKSASPDGCARVLIVDDSAVARAVIGRMVDAANGFAVAAAVADVHAALAYLKGERVDIVLLDIEMPGIDGLTALPELLAAGQGAKVLVVSSSCAEGAAATIQALTLGAADTLVKPGVGNFVGRFADVLTDKLTRLADHDQRQAVAVMPAVVPRLVGNDFDVVAIGASTGGIHALGKLLRGIPASFQLPILVTQHLPATFMPYFAAQLAVLGGRPAVVAEDHMRLLRGRIYIAPGDAHMRCARFSDGVSLRLSTEKAESGCMPSVDPMLETVAEVFGARALAIVLSGMGRDGAAGAKIVAAAGGVVAAQDRATSVVWGMPGAVVNGGYAHVVIPPDEIGHLIAAQRRP